MRRSIITSPQVLATAASYAAKCKADRFAKSRALMADLEHHLAESDARRSDVVSTASDLDRQSKVALDAYNEGQADDIIAGDPLRPMSREVAELVQKARQVAGSTPAALEKLARERSDLSARLIEAKAAFAGEVFDDVRQRQKAAQQTITDGLAAIAPALTELLALTEVQRRYCGGERTIKLNPGEATPWAGDVVVRNFTERLPLHFKSPAIELLTLTEQSSATVKELVAEIEGNT